MTFADIQRLLMPIKRKIFLLFGRGIVEAIDNTGKTQKIQVTGLNNETITDIERLQNYGFESYPDIDSDLEAALLFGYGNRDQGISVCVHDRDNRPTDLTVGDVRVYDKNSNKITLDSDGILIEDANGNTITLDSDGMLVEDTNGNTIEMKSGEINITGTKINLLGASESFVLGDTTKTELIKDQTLMQTLQTAINGWVPVPMDGGAALKTALAGFLALSQANYSNILSSKIQGDIKYEDNDLVRENGLETSVIMSLFTDRRAEDDDPLDDIEDKKGWWADSTSDIDGDQIGSRIWLLNRSKTTTDTEIKLKEYALEALDWMIEDGVVQDVKATVERLGTPGNDILGLKVEILKIDGNIETFKFDDLWNTQLGL
jgi:phage baseplate assembly protein V